MLKSDIQLYPAWVAPSPEVAIRARFALRELLQEMGWPDACKITVTGPAVVRYRSPSTR